MLGIVIAMKKEFTLLEKEFLLGSIAPDISKQVGESKLHSHFLTSIERDIPELDEFLKKYSAEKFLELLKNDLKDEITEGKEVELKGDVVDDGPDFEGGYQISFEKTRIENNSNHLFNE